MWFILGVCGNKKFVKLCLKKCFLKDWFVCGIDNKIYKNGCFFVVVKCVLFKKDRGLFCL